MLSFNYNGSVVDSALYATSAIYLTQGVLAFLTGDTNAVPSERMRITSGGNVGIGTTNPGAKLEIASGFVRVQGTDSDQYFFEGIRTGVSTTLRIYDNSSVVFYDAFNSMFFRANQNGGSGGNIILTGGNVGIGTTSPARKLQVEVGSTAEGGQNWSHSNGTVFARLGIVNPGVNNNTEFGAASNNDLVLLTNNNERLRITSGGNVGIGTTPSYKLDVNGSQRWIFRNSSSEITDLLVSTESANSKSKLSFLWYGNETAALKFKRGGDSTGSEIELWTQQEGSSIAQRLTINTSGNVGIGTTSPATKLHVVGSQTLTSSTGIFIEDFYSSGGFTKIGSKYQTTNNCRAEVRFINPATGADSDMSFAVSDAGNNLYNAMYIKGAGGNVGIGTTSPSHPLHVVNSGVYHITAEQSSTNTSNTSAYATFYVINNAGTSQVRGYLGAGGASVGNTPMQNHVYVGSQSNHGVRFFTNDSVKMTIEAGGYIGMGITSPRGRGEIVTGLPTSYPNMAERTTGFIVSDGGAIGGRIGVADRTSAGQGYPTYIQAGDLTTSTLYYELRLNPNGGAVFAGSVRLDTLSDERVKDNIQPIQGALNKILSITGKKFHLKDEPEDKLRYGFIAQELEGILDEFVIQSDTTFKKDDLVVENVKSIENWASSWAALLVESIKEQQAQIEILKTEIQTLKQS
jgi:hypothetical protein